MKKDLQQFKLIVKSELALEIWKTRNRLEKKQGEPPRPNYSLTRKMHSKTELAWITTYKENKTSQEDGVRSHYQLPFHAIKSFLVSDLVHSIHHPLWSEPSRVPAGLKRP
jgi:hypothetical protein